MTAQANLAKQLREHELYLVSLNAKWRAVGSPQGQDPRTWLLGVEALVGEMGRYLQPLEFPSPLDDGRPGPVWRWPRDLEPRDDWFEGDTLAIPALAELYAIFLDASVID